MYLVLNYKCVAESNEPSAAPIVWLTTLESNQASRINSPAPTPCLLVVNKFGHPWVSRTPAACFQNRNATVTLRGENNRMLSLSRESNPRDLPPTGWPPNVLAGVRFFAEHILKNNRIAFVARHPKLAYCLL